MNEYDENPEDLAPSPEAEQDEIFRSGKAGKTWRNRKLFPWSYERRVAGDGMGFKALKLTAEEWETLDATGTYAGLDRDLAILLWTLLATESEIRRAQRLPDAALQKALELAEREDLEPGSKSYTAAGKLMLEELLNRAKVRGKFKAPGESAKKGNPRGK